MLRFGICTLTPLANLYARLERFKSQVTSDMLVKRVIFDRGMCTHESRCKALTKGGRGARARAKPVQYRAISKSVHTSCGGGLCTPFSAKIDLIGCNMLAGRWQICQPVVSFALSEQ